VAQEFELVAVVRRKARRRAVVKEIGDCGVEAAGGGKPASNAHARGTNARCTAINAREGAEHSRRR